MGEKAGVMVGEIKSTEPLWIKDFCGQMGEMNNFIE
jgi:hypothetical protein